MTKALIIDDEQSICWGLEKLCAQMAIEATSASTAEAGLELAKKTAFDLLIMDVRLPGIDGLEAIPRFRDVAGEIPIITITAFGDMRTAIDAIQKGAFEYILKPFELDTVRKTIRQAVATSRLRDKTEASPDNDESNEYSADTIVGTSRLMQEVFKQIALTTTSNAPVLVTGESGTGKELTARSIHNHSSRADQPFVAVNIAALNPQLAESELFGHVKGAFTGADSDRIGLLERAYGGTLFLDEVAEIPIEIQVKLLRTLDQNELTPVGSSSPRKTDFRLISATNQDLLSQVNHGDFRLDLFYRLRTFEIQIPPLRQRPEDIPTLVRHFLGAKQDSFILSDDFVQELSRRTWPGNIRELKSVIERAATLARGGVLTPEHLEKSESIQTVDGQTNQVANMQAWVRDWTTANWSQASMDELYNELIAVIEPAILKTAFDLSGEQYSAAARRLGIHRTTLKKRLEEME